MVRFDGSKVCESCRDGVCLEDDIELDVDVILQFILFAELCCRQTMPVTVAALINAFAQGSSYAPLDGHGLLS